ncbi:MAG: tRNA pseudouridine(55) synthase TruB [Candidatus Magasanikbacteria bacterium CG11_big_fil_rev_8_21_14_0_20_39_34]|uniref:tRNA pseudouridine synthase B n=1 Tax=Candidatus Magasanikbacteria bacterium CG11_big_fil_rev_8_21_14_0_20_39_34 TaxID=1974653 RepID=A0A2H0N4U5_9BACT|nr:MAG: tRNA pseudouridine(55) synthase TruB [Candidatus Magasanikbacteria bacterium CG11_big_fil_rev_8_21_14_0_20_39_34]
MAEFLLIDKPEDWTSHDVVAYLRRVLKIKKIGHAGTLDPFATGLLIVGVAREATKRLDEFKSLPKTYIATLKFGFTSNTFDKTGTIEKYASEGKLDLSRLQTVLEQCIGRQLQLPPMFSAKKVKGKKLYELARKGIEVEREPNEIEIYDLLLLSTTEDTATIEVSCSVGTYIRTLCHDIGEKLGIGAYCEELRRTKIGEYKVEQATPPQQISSENPPFFLL